MNHRISEFSVTTDELQQCLEVTTRFFWLLDHNRYADLMGLMADSAVWYRQGLELRPGQEMMTVLERRSPTRVVAHLLSNLLATPMHADRVLVTGYMTAYAHDEGTAPSSPAPLNGPTSVTKLHVELIRGTMGWQLDLSRSQPLFRR